MLLTSDTPHNYDYIGAQCDSQMFIYASAYYGLVGSESAVSLNSQFEY